MDSSTHAGMCGGKDWVVVGVSGVTCGGKTTFAQALHEQFPKSTILHQDTYFLDPSDPRHTVVPSLKHLNWEIASSLDMEKMNKDIKEILARPPPEVPLLIIEGFLIFTDRYISSVCHHKLFFTLREEECWARRSVRTYDPPDVPGYFQQVQTCTQDYLLSVVWPEYERHLQLALTINPDLTLVPGTQHSDILLEDLKDILCDKLSCTRL